MSKSAKVTMVEHPGHGWTVDVKAGLDEWGLDRTSHYRPFGDAGYYMHPEALKVATELLKELERLGYTVTRHGATAPKY